MMSFYYKVRETRQNLWTMKYRSEDLQIVCGHSPCRLNKYPKYDAFLFETVGDIRQNHLTMKYRSQ